jgi:hypothetical protein
MKKIVLRRVLGTLAAAWAAVFFCGASLRVLADCASFGLPFTDLGSESGFCAAIAEAYYTGITNGTSATTFAPKADVTRAQAAAFAARTLDASLARGSRRAALGQWWTTTPHWDLGLGVTDVGLGPQFLVSDGSDVWVTNHGDSTVTRVRGSDGGVVESWSVSALPFAVLSAMGRIFVSGGGGALFMIDPAQSPNPQQPVAELGGTALELAFDGDKIWSANSTGSVSIVTPGSWDIATKTEGFNYTYGVVFDGHSIWVTDAGDSVIRKLDASGAILQNVAVGEAPAFPVFDGRNLWVPNQSGDSITVVRAADGVVIATLTGNGLNRPLQAAFDGRRILVTNHSGGLSLFDASTLEPITHTGTAGLGLPVGVCNDGTDFWVAFAASAKIARF